MGFMGKILRVNLTTGDTAREPLDMDRAKAFIGGRGLGIASAPTGRWWGKR